MAKFRVEREPVVQPLDESIKLIPLTRGKIAIVDADNYDWLMKWNWSLTGSIAKDNFYASRMIVRKKKWIPIWMHRVVIGARQGEIVDHINGDTLDNRRANLRKCTTSQNAQNHKILSSNTSGVSGVTWHKRDHLWQVAIRDRGKRIYIGFFKEKERAIQEHEEAIKKFHKEFARLNHSNPQC
jgi:hypothetical protein